LRKNNLIAYDIGMDNQILQISQTVKELRQLRGITQAELANSLGVKQSCVSKWERGNTVPNVVQIIALARFFDVSADYILGISNI
jgi:transcriptional regulator with XRE-family HTH domain